MTNIPFEQIVKILIDRFLTEVTKDLARFLRERAWVRTGRLRDSIRALPKSRRVRMVFYGGFVSRPHLTGERWVRLALRAYEQSGRPEKIWAKVSRQVEAQFNAS